MNPTLRNRYLGALLGLACGDALGSAVEFRRRGTFPPVTHMQGGGPFSLKPGEWTDDTSMALCLAVSLLEREQFDARDQMERYCRWAREGHLSSNGECFDIGSTVADALRQFRATGDPYSGPTNTYSAGNGCIMRLAPVVLFYYPERQKVLEMAAASSRTTHGATECLEACQMLASVLFDLLEGHPRDDLLNASRWDFLKTLSSPRLRQITAGSFRMKAIEAISGSGYVADCLEASLWCFSRTTNFRDAVLMAANLGEDADTTGAVCGQIAGAHYGLEDIPQAWLDVLAKRSLIEDIAAKLHDNASARLLNKL